MSAIQGIKAYYSLFGSRGVWLAGMARLLGQSTQVDVTVEGIKHPVRVRLRTSDVQVLRQVLVIKEYDCDFAKPPAVIIDAGANIGLTSVFYTNKYPTAKIFAIEPESSNYELLKHNTALYPNVNAIQAALWNENKRITIVDPGMGHYGFQTKSEPTPDLNTGNRNVQGVTVDKLMSDFGLGQVDILKMDIEGSEREVFENASRWIDRVGAIVIELHDRMRPGCGESFSLASKCFKTLFQKGETLFVARAEYLIPEQLQPRETRDSYGSHLASAASGPPCKILKSLGS
jgi:FkbM family methyltransferase